MIAKALISSQNWKYVFKTLAKNKTRSILTALGIIIGVWSVIVLVAIGNGLKSYISQQFEDLGTNTLFVMPMNKSHMKGGSSFGPPAMISFKERDLKNIKSVKLASLVVPTTNKSTFVSAGKESLFTEVLGTTEDMKISSNLIPEFGRFFNSAEEKRGRKVATIGWKVKDELYGDQNPVDKKIKIDDKIFTIIGSMEKKGGASGAIGADYDNKVYIPYKAMWRLTDVKEFNFLLVSAKNQEDIEPLKKDLEKILLKDYDEEEFSVVEQSELLKTVTSILNIFTAGLAGIAAISLIVGGVGIMNVMLVSVRERTREVGLRKAVGATNSDILFQFLFESVILSIAGGLVGLLLAIITTLIINNFFPSSITLWSVLLAIAVSAVVGIIFGIAPARKASKLAPVDALRYE